MAAKIDKRELEEPDKLQEYFLKIRAYVENHRRQIYAAAGCLALLMVLVGGWYVYHLSYENSAERLYVRVLEVAMKAGSPAGDEAALKGYRDLIGQYPHSRAAVFAYYRLGNLYLGRGEIDTAVTAYQDFLKRASSESDLLPLAYGGIGSCYEIKKDFKKAIEYYDKAVKSDTGLMFEALNYGGMARAYEAMNERAKAVEYYQKALGKTTDPLMTLYLKRKISLLG